MNELTSIHTKNLDSVFRRVGFSLLVTTYQAGQAILIRAQGDKINTDYTGFNRPMGVAFDGQRLAIASSGRITEYYNVPAAAKKIEADHPHDGCFVPRNIHFTGSIDPHEMVYTNRGLVVVNTRMSCLALVENDSSFRPIWKPDFITEYSLDDRCHLNGVTKDYGLPTYVTALGESDTPRGWHEERHTRGLIINSQTNEIVADDLSMPHSPRWHNGALYYLESGLGTINRYDPATGKHKAYATIGGFVRGLSIIGSLAIVGISKDRGEHSLGNESPHCGIVLFDLNNDKIVGALTFTGNVSEIFAVQALPMTNPVLLPEVDDLTASTFSLPDEIVAHIKKTGD